MEALRCVETEPATAVLVETLGGFQVRRESRIVRAGEWRSRKARTLLKVLVARRRRPVPRDVLIDILWPGADPVPLANRFAVALSTARSVLDPSRRHPTQHFIRSDGPALAATDNLTVDVYEFLEDVALARRLMAADPASAAGCLASADARYAGDFLEEDIYEDWSVDLREAARAASTWVVRTLAERARTAGDYQSVIRYQLRILERDPYDEPAHVELVAALSAAGRHGEARRRHLLYAARMREIGVEPAPSESALALSARPPVLVSSAGADLELAGFASVAAR